MSESFRDTQYKERIVKVEELFAQLRLVEQGKMFIDELYSRFGIIEEAETAFDDLRDHYKCNQEDIEDLEEEIAELKDEVSYLKDELRELKGERHDLKNDIAEFKKQINAAITSDNTSDGEVVDKLMELLNEYL